MHDLSGSAFGSLSVISEAPRQGSRRMWLCSCVCGSTKVVAQGHLKSGHTQSCGCLASAALVARNTTHGMTYTATYRVWRSMIDRCYTPSSTSYKRYGARGVEVCDRWRESFENFLADMGEAKNGLTLDRTDGSKGYSPDNCQWATPREQALNRRTTIWVEHLGKRQCLKDWATELNITYLTLYKRFVVRKKPFHEAIKGD